VFDHHFGFEEYWNSRLGERARIEPIGAAATLIWEAFRIRGFAKGISRESAILLAHAIVSNTVNFLVGLSGDRDRAALAELVNIAGLKENWIARYFHSVQKRIEQNPEEAIRNDTKIFSFPVY
jgi:inorganic pyrophosphatase/manganese-dependent inorganic pyrophosphatase